MIRHPWIRPARDRHALLGRAPARQVRTPVQFDALEPRTLLTMIHWDGGAGDNSFTNPLNWGGDVLPGPLDIAVINVPGQTITVEYNDPGQHNVFGLYSEENLTISSGTLLAFNENFMNGTLSITGGSLLLGILWKQNGPLELSGGSIDGIGTCVLNGSGTWTGGKLGDLASPNGRFQVGATGTLTINGDVTLKRALVNAGTISWVGGTISVRRGSIHNLPGRTITLPVDATIVNIEEPSGAVVNRGTLVATGGTTTIAVRLYQPATGSLDVQAGTLRLERTGNVAGSLSLPVGTLLEFAGVTSQVTFNVGPAAAVTLAGGIRVLQGTLVLKPAGLSPATVEVSGGGLLFTEDVTIGDVSMLGGQLRGTGDVTVTGSMIWSGGKIGTPLGLAAGLIIPVGVTLTIDAGALGVTLDRPLENSGTVFWVSGEIRLSRLITNNANAEFDIPGNVTLKSALSTAAFTNQGTVNKQGSGMASLLRSAATRPFGNAGTVVVAEGMLSIGGGGSGAGSFAIASDATLQFGWRGYTLDPGASISGQGALVFTRDGFIGSQNVLELHGTIDVGLLIVASNVDLDEAAVSIDAMELRTGGKLSGQEDLVIDFPLEWLGGELAGTASYLIASGATVTVSEGTQSSHVVQRPLVNSGVLVLASGSLYLYSTGSLLNDTDGIFRLDAGTLSVAVGGVLDNMGLIEKVGPNLVTIDGTTDLTGSVSVAGGTLRILGGEHGAVFDVLSGATLQIGSGATLAVDSAITGAGTIEFGVGNPVLTTSVAGSIDAALVRIVGRVAFDGATLAPGSMVLVENGRITGTQDLVIDFPFSWTGGTIDVDGTVMVAVGAVLTLQTSGTCTLSGALQNQGTVDIVSGRLDVSGSGAFTNAANGSLIVREGQFTAGGSSSLVNQGLIAKMGTGTFAFGVTGSGSLNVDGAVNVEDGTLLLASGAHDGAFSIASGAVLELAAGAGGLTLSSSSLVTGLGTLRATRGATTMQGAMDVATLEVSTPAGGLTPTNLLLAGLAKTIGSVAFSGGTLRIGPGVDVSVTGDYQQTGGTLRPRIAGAAPTEYGRLSVGATALLAGGFDVALAIEYVTGFTPVAGQTFDLMTFATLSGQFGTVQFPVQPPGLVADLDYLPGIVRLRIVPQ